MKKLIKSFLMAAAALMLFAGCNGLIDATVSGDPNKAVITIGIDGLTESTSISRTINPSGLDSTTGLSESDFGFLTISGVSEKGDSIAEKDSEGKLIKFTKASDGKYKIELSYDVWYLTLRAYSKGDTPVLLLEGRKRVDMKNGAPTGGASITFNLSTEGVTTDGGVSLAGTFVDTNGLATSYSAALYNLNSNEVIINTANTSTLKTGTCTGDNKGKFSYEVASVKPGRYNFRIYFKNSDGVSIGTWGEEVVIAPGRTTTETSIAIEKDILMKKPNAPTALSAYYINNSENEGYYNTLVTWTRDTIHNEEYFELTINDVTEETATTYRVLGTEASTTATDKKEVFFESTSRVDGTLAAGSEYCIVKLPIGKKFEISIKAVNILGKSDAKARDSAATASEITLSNGNAVAANTPYGEENINLMKITYDLNGGTLKLSETTNKFGSYVEYKIYKGSAITLIVPKTAGGTEYPQVFDGKYPWQNWIDETIAGTDKSITSISTFGNKTVKASYNITSIINYTINDTYGTITATAETASGVSVVNGTVENNGNLTFAVDDDTVTHIKVTFLNPNGEDRYAEADGNSVVFKRMNDLPNGYTYEVQVIATKTDGKMYSFVCAITKNI